MKSIDRLREYVENAPRTSIGLMGRAILLGMVRTIEQEAEATHRSASDAETFADRLKAAVDEREDVTLWGVDYMPCPLDADGEPIHVGDVMEWPDCSTAEVVGIGDGTFFYVEDGEDAADWSCVSDKIHHRATTVEDVLDEFASAYDRIGGADEEHQLYLNLIAEYAAKLRLAGDE